MDSVPVPEFDRSGGRAIITSPFGPRWGRTHQGDDIGTTDGIEIGTPAHPTAAGRLVNILFDGPKPSAGLNAWFLEDSGKRRKYFHLNRVTVSIGTHLEVGDQLGEVGNSGTDAAHLHLETHVGSWSNPVNATQELRDAMAAGRWPRKAAPPPPPPIPQEDDMTTLAEVQQEFVNQDARMAAFLNAAFAAQTKAVLEAVGTIVGGGTVDPSAFADAVAEELAERLSA